MCSQEGYRTQSNATCMLAYLRWQSLKIYTSALLSMLSELEVSLNIFSFQITSEGNGIEQQRTRI